ncbi:glycosyltransferase [Rhodococcus hoagii]|nr:glycosyltransferase [Prescottella equi]NKS66147.1 glycosyltransferase [Prescottella equi]
MRLQNDMLNNVLFVSHTAEPGGAELAIARYLNAKEESAPQILFLEPGPVADQVAGAIVGPTGSSNSAKVRIINDTIRQLRPTMVVSNTMRAALLVGLSRVRTSDHVYYLRDELSAAHLSWSKNLIMEMLLRFRVGGIVANSAPTVESIPSSRLRRSAQIAMSCSGMTDVAVEAARTKRKMSAEGPVKLLSLSRIAEWKGQHVLLEALDVLANRGVDQSALTVTIAGAPLFGEKQYAARVAEMASNSPFEVRMVGHQSDVANVLRSHDLLVHTSLSPEPFGQVIVQGLAHGLGVVASSGGGPSEILRDGAGMLWKTNDVESLADCIAEMMKPSTRQQYVERGFTRALEYTDARAVESLDGVLSSYLAHRWSGDLMECE